MIQFMPGAKVYLACRPVSMRYDFDGLSAKVANVLRADPFSGYLLLFRSKRDDYLKILYRDGSGFCQNQPPRWILDKNLVGSWLGSRPPSLELIAATSSPASRTLPGLNSKRFASSSSNRCRHYRNQKSDPLCLFHGMY